MRQKSDPNESGLGPLFSPPIRTLSGRTDPATSKAAAQKMKHSGQLAADQALALSMVRDCPGATCPELAAKAASLDEEHRSADFWRQKIGRRLNELTRTDPPLIQARHASGSYACWWPVDFKKED